MLYIIDADFAIEAMRGHPEARGIVGRLVRRQIGISVCTLGEVYEVAFMAANPTARLVQFQQFFAPFTSIPVDDSIVLRFAELRAFLRRRGQMISDFDLVLAATALAYDLTVLTFNQPHLNRIPDVRLYPLDG